MCIGYRKNRYPFRGYSLLSKAASSYRFLFFFFEKKKRGCVNHSTGKTSNTDMSSVTYLLGYALPWRRNLGFDKLKEQCYYYSEPLLNSTPLHFVSLYFKFCMSDSVLKKNKKTKRIQKFSGCSKR